MHWYIAKFIYQIVCGDGNHTAQFDEQLRLISALNEDDVFEKCISLGKQEEDNFYNNDQMLVSWKFINIAELYPLNELIDGAEVYSRIKEVYDAHGYITFVNKKAAAIVEKQKKPVDINLIH